MNMANGVVLSRATKRIQALVYRIGKGSFMNARQETYGDVQVSPTGSIVITISVSILGMSTVFSSSSLDNKWNTMDGEV